MTKNVRDMVEGMSEADARAMAQVQQYLRDVIARVPGADQVESRLRAFTLLASTCTSMMGAPVVVTWCEAEGVLHQCHADGKVRTTTVAGEGATEGVRH